jgi:hypothetical protein
VNSQLKDHVYDIPNDVLEKINSVLSKVTDESVHGVQRAKRLCSEKKVTYGQLKRIIHDIKTIDKENDNLRYELYGGELMEKWANSFLDGQRNLVKTKKQSSQKINNLTGMDGMRKNPFLSNHSKSDKKTSYKNFLKSNSDETSVSPISSVGIFEEIERIKRLML